MKRFALSLLICLGAAALALAQEETVERTVRRKAVGPEAATSTLELNHQTAMAGGKYRMLLRQIAVERDAASYGDFRDYGPWTGSEWAGHKDLPAGHWVYAKPYWYIWRDLSADPRPMRRWGPEQATGGPDTPGSGDLDTAWASLSQDGQEEWLMLEYEAHMVPKAIVVHETFNPGAVVKVTAFRLDGEEVTLWTGKDPTAIGAARGESVLPVQGDFKTNRLKLYLDSVAVPGWNEIDAVGLVDAGNKTQWATAAHASTTYAEPDAPLVPRSGPDVLTSPQPEALQARIARLEAELARQADLIRKLQEQLRERPRPAEKK